MAMSADIWAGRKSLFVAAVGGACQPDPACIRSERGSIVFEGDVVSLSTIASSALLSSSNSPMGSSAFGSSVSSFSCRALLPNAGICCGRCCFDCGGKGGAHVCGCGCCCGRGGGGKGAFHVARSGVNACCCFCVEAGGAHGCCCRFCDGGGGKGVFPAD